MTLPDQPPLPHAVRRSVLLLSLACFCSMATQRICDAMLPELSREFNASMARAAQVVSVFAVVYGLAQLFYGSLGDRYGKLRVLTYTTLASGLGCLLAAFATSLDFLVAARVVMAMFAAAIIPLSLAWTGDAVPYDQRQETLARVGLGTTMGIVGGQLMGGLFTDTLGWRWAFVLMTVLFVSVGTLLRRSFSAMPAPLARGESGLGALTQVRHILRGSWPRKLLAVSLTQGAAGFGTVAIIATHLHEVHGLSLASAGAVVALFGLGGVIYMSLARHLIRRLGEQGMVRVGGCGMGVAMFTIGLSPWWPLAPAAMLLGGFAFFMLHNTLQANATQIAPESRGLGVAMFATALFFGQALGVLVVASLSAHIGTGLVMAGGGMTMAGMALYLSRQLRQRHRLAASAGG